MMNFTKKNINKIRYCVMIIILCQYIFRGIMLFFGIKNLVYISTILAFLICIFNIEYTLRKDILLFFASGIASLLYSFCILGSSGMLSSIIGFGSVYGNLLLWTILFNNFSQKEKEEACEKYKIVLIILAVITSLAGYYQFFVDTSLNGLAYNELYGNSDLMESGRFVRRATAFLGSAQNYAIFIGIGFVINYFFSYKSKVLYFIVNLVLIGGVLVSGSRSASVSVLICIFIDRVYCIYKQSNSSFRLSNLLLYSTLIISVLICGYNFLQTNTFYRLFDFSFADAAKEAYISVFSDLGFTELLFGRGFGYKSWPVMQFLGLEDYYNIYKSSYVSYESTLLFVFSQVGIVGLIFYMNLYYNSLKNSLKKDISCFVIIVCIMVNQVFTPSFTGLAMSFVLWPFILNP